MIYYFSLGSNVGEREITIQRALQYIEQQIGHVLCCSSFYYSDPVDFESEHPFCNICCAVESIHTPNQVLEQTQDIEKKLGRTHKSNHHATKPTYQDRTIDIDIILLFHNNQSITINTPTLTIPHPHWTKRDFVTIPLTEIWNQIGNQTKTAASHKA